MNFKKLTLLSVVAALCLCFPARGQTVKKVTPPQVPGLQIGQQVPDIPLKNLHNYKNAKGEPATTAQLADFKGKLLILDFWATWCTPCVAMMPKMDSLQRQFGDKIQFLSLSYEKADVVFPFLAELEKRRGQAFCLPNISDEKVLHQLFPHAALPHYVWIDAEGVVRAMTGMEEVTSENIALALERSYAMSLKAEVPIKLNRDIPLVVQNIPGHIEKLLINSSLSKYVEGFPSSFTTKYQTDSTAFRATYTNLSIASLFQLAYANEGNFRAARFIIDSNVERGPFTYPKDRTALREWHKENTYCYELLIAPELKWTINDFYRQMQRDMSVYFPYKTTIETKNLTCLALVRVDSTKQLLTKDKSSRPLRIINLKGFDGINISLSKLVQPLSTYYLQNYPLPVVDNTGYKQPVDISIKADMTNVEAINKGLQPYGLQFVQMEVPTTVLIVHNP